MAKFYLQVYGCQMNHYEANLVRDILTRASYTETENEESADVLLMVTCAVREHAEQRALGRLATFNAYKNKEPRKIIGVLGCIAQRLGEKLTVDYGADLVVGPDGYRQLPELLNRRKNGAPPQLAIKINGECYSEIYPQTRNAVTANVTIMRGCNNFCSYCVVPYVKGPERSNRSKAVGASWCKGSDSIRAECSCLPRSGNQFFRPVSGGLQSNGHRANSISYFSSP